jgi:FMN phosphatase YigB (HAD superfamily)
VSARRALLLDFDGTTCIGDDPVYEYARLASANLPTAEASRLTATVSAFLNGRIDDGVLAQAMDGYQAVETMGRTLGVGQPDLQAAFLTVRARLNTGEIAVHTPTGLIEFLAEMRAAGVRLVLATNSPAEGLDALLSRLELHDAVDDVIADAGKPAGMAAIVDDVLEAIDAHDEPERLLSVGDIWENDLRIPLERGCRTAYVDRFDRHAGPAHARASGIEDLFAPIREWSR